MPGEGNWLRERLEELERIERPSASEGERQAAEWLVARFGEQGAEARIEAETELPRESTFFLCLEALGSDHQATTTGPPT